MPWLRLDAYAIKFPTQVCVTQSLQFVVDWEFSLMIQWMRQHASKLYNLWYTIRCTSNSSKSCRLYHLTACCVLLIDDLLFSPRWAPSSMGVSCPFLVALSSVDTSKEHGSGCFHELWKCNTLDYCPYIVKIKVLNMTLLWNQYH